MMQSEGILEKALLFSRVGGVVGLKWYSDMPAQVLKAPAPMPVTLLGIVIDVNPVQLLKALASIYVTLSGIIMDERL